MSISMQEIRDIAPAVRENSRLPFRQASLELKVQWERIATENRMAQDMFVWSLIDELVLAKDLSSHFQNESARLLQGADTCS